MSGVRERLHLWLTAVALAAAIGLPLLLHGPAAENGYAPEWHPLARCVAAVLAIEDLGPHAQIGVIAWLCPPPSPSDRWIDALR